MRRRRKRRPSLRWKVLLGAGAPLAFGVLALGVWEEFFLRIDSLRSPSAVRVLEVPTPSGSRRLVLGPESPYWTPLGAISPTLRMVVVKSEDTKFYQHSGFDWEELHDSFEQNLEEGEYKRGGSTITMQLARNLFLWRDKSLLRKVLEVYLTWRLEHTLEKKRILELYLNTVEWGAGIYGIGEASRHYFQKPPSDLTLGESAMLAGILPSPIRWSPDRNPAVAMRRQQELLSRMRRENALGDLE